MVLRKKKYNDWDPLSDFTYELNTVARKRDYRMEEHKAFVKRILGN